MNRVPRFGFALIGLALCFGCAGSPELTIRSTLPNASPSPQVDAATIVVLRPGQYAPGRSVNIVDAHGRRVVAQLGAEEWAAFSLPPGPIDLFTTLGDIGMFDPVWARIQPRDRVTGEVHAGRVYHLYVNPVAEDGWSCRACGRFEIMRPTHEHYASIPRFLREQTRVEVNRARAESYARTEFDTLREAYAAATARFAAFDQVRRGDRTLGDNDGLGERSSATIARAPSAPSRAPSSACGPGTLRHDGQCISACNPLCPAGSYCTTQAECQMGCVSNSNCGEGQLCHQGECISACNPRCPNGARCAGAGECVAM